MKWALLSDIHANIQALQACAAHATRLGAERWAVLGDLVGYGGDPLPVVEQVMRWHAEGACVLQGNHDAMAVTPPQAEASLGASTAAWTYQQLPPACRRFLAHLPLTQRFEHMLLVHASAHHPRNGAMSTTSALPASAWTLRCRASTAPTFLWAMCTSKPCITRAAARA